MNKTVLLKWSGNWADEMDLAGWALVTSEEVDQIWEELPNYDDYFEEYFGTNEFITWGSGKELLSELTRIDVTPEQAQFLTDTFLGKWRNTYGHFPDSVFGIDDKDEW